MGQRTNVDAEEITPLSPPAIALYLHVVSGGSTISFHLRSGLPLTDVAAAVNELEGKTDFRYPPIKQRRHVRSKAPGEVHAK